MLGTFFKLSVQMNTPLSCLAYLREAELRKRLNNKEQRGKLEKLGWNTQSLDKIMNPQPTKNPHAQALGRLGGKAGKGQSKARTSEQARAAVMVRWNAKRQGEYDAGFKSGLLHNESDPLCLENIRKMEHAIATRPSDDLVRHYWTGYKDGLLAVAK